MTRKDERTTGDYASLCGLIDAIKGLRAGIVLDASSFGYNPEAFPSLDELACQIFDDHHLRTITEEFCLYYGMTESTYRSLHELGTVLDRLFARIEVGRASFQDWQSVHDAAKEVVKNSEDWIVGNSS